ncbi:MAG: hypothetical protein ACRCXZ_06255 [Patescibacteria group bacterium]
MQPSKDFKGFRTLDFHMVPIVREQEKKILTLVASVTILTNYFEVYLGPEGLYHLIAEGQYLLAMIKPQEIDDISINPKADGIAYMLNDIEYYIPYKEEALDNTEST